MGSDTYGADSGAWLVNERSDPKVFTRKVRLVDQPGDSFIIGFGCTSSYRMIQLLQYELLLPDYNTNIHSPMEWVVTKLIPAIRECFKTAGFSKIENSVERGGNFIVTFQGNLFEVDSDFQVMDYSKQEHTAVGCGQQLATGALFVAELEGLTPKCMCEVAIRAAIRYSAYCNGSINIIEVK